MSVNVPARLLREMDRPAPRYTSYPTVPAWQQDFGEDDYRPALSELAERPDDDLSLYLHLPFCARQCDYCGCNTAPAAGRSAVDRYVDRLQAEMTRVAGILGTGRRVTQMHWGGGTPNFLRDEQLTRTWNLCAETFDLEPGGELSLEVDPRMATPRQIERLRGLGFNRISLGVQDFEESVQEAIGRRQSRERTLEVYATCRAADFESVNLDLVYGLPGQTADSFDRTLAAILQQAPDRIACFGYAHVPWVRPNQQAIDESLLPAPGQKFALFRQAIARAEEAGYRWIGLDHFARADDELSVAHRERRLHRNFMGYTTRPAPHMLAFGMSGIGEVADRFVQNDADIAGWETAVDAGRLPVVKGHRLSRDDRLRRLVILNLMCNLELPFELTRDEFDAPADELLADELARLEPLVERDLVTRDADGLRVTELGRFFIRNICVEFDAYLQESGDRPLFSRTV